MKYENIYMYIYVNGFSLNNNTGLLFLKTAEYNLCGVCPFYIFENAYNFRRLENSLWLTFRAGEKFIYVRIYI